MKDDSSNSGETSKKLSRRNVLRNTVITATGVALLPSFITGCTKDIGNMLPWQGKHPGAGGVGGVALTPEELANAAENLKRLRTWILDLYPLCIEYEDAVFHALASTKENGTWTNFIADIFIDIGIGLASAAAIASGGAAAVPAFACLSAFLHDWGIGKDKPSDLDKELASFEFKHNAMQFAIEQRLSALVEPKNNYSNLTAAWKDNIDFMGKTYTLGDLATKEFPGLGDDYNALQAAAYEYFRKALWNLVIMKCCTYYENYHFHAEIPESISYTQYGRDTFYLPWPGHEGVYMRGAPYSAGNGFKTYYTVYWNLGIGGYPFPIEACNILFKDDTPGHIINEKGLFNRSYVFQQFSFTKPNFAPYHELSTDVTQDFDPTADDWEFTGGLFPKLTR